MLAGILQAVQSVIEEVVEKYRNYMKAVAFRIVKDEHLAEDAVQNALIRIHQNLSKIDNIHSRRTKNFIITITRNAAITMLNQEKKIEDNVRFMTEEEFNSIEGEVDIKAFCDRYGFSAEISDALSSVGEVDKGILILRYGMGYNCREIAKLLQMSEDSVYKRCQRACKLLQEILAQGVK